MPAVIQVTPTPIVRKAPPKVVGPTNANPIRPTKKLPQYMINEGLARQPVQFDATKHLNFKKPSKLYTMEEIGLGGEGVSHIAASEPFSLFTPEAIRQIRAEIFSPEVLENNQFASAFASNMIRGYGPKLAPFIFDAYNSPEFLRVISDLAGLDLVPASDWETGHTNVWFEDGQVDANRTEKSAFSWHRDSFPFVCVTMLSDCTGMTGGETAMRMGTGDIMKVRGPSMGTSCIMQGRYIEHAALTAEGIPERIAIVTAFRPKDPLVTDEIILTGSRPISHKEDLYYQYSRYRLDVIEARSRHQFKKIMEHKRYGRDFDANEMKQWLAQQRDFIDAWMGELI
ncbi:unnamed protein product [Clonostachys byssicola]|uniref:Fe2OG dioxygenase domain-containing protein n=1 Tax=Clonostachys byssicola TaxID=160290 RepID=A0A9N9UAT0_9HYPO|nr:unnamed protein product [Clonostachys byssicola]